MRTTLRALVLLLGLGLCIVPSASRSQGVRGPALLPGQTATQLPDGRWLLLGGQGVSGPLSAAVLWDPRTQMSALLPQPLGRARAWHTATLEPDGAVIVVGGLGGDGQTVPDIELFDAATQTFQVLASTGIAPRANHTATLLTDGRILIAGGVGTRGQTLADGQLWDAVSHQVDANRVLLTGARRDAVAILLPDGTVLLWGGVDGNGVPLATGDVFDPLAARFSLVAQMPPGAQNLPIPPEMSASMPTAGSTDVAVDSILAMRFSKLLQAESLSSLTVTLSGPLGPLSAFVVPAEAGRLAFVTPQVSLQPGTVYTLAVNGAVDRSGFLLPFTSISFVTAASGPGVPGPGPGGTPPGGPPGSPPKGQPGGLRDDDMVWRGETRDGKPYSRWQELPPLHAPRGVTALAGQVLRLDGEPLPDVTLQIDRAWTRSDRTGRFLLTGISAGHQVLLIDARTANRPGRAYGVFEVGVDIAGGTTTVLPFTSWQPRLDTDHEVLIPSPTQSEVVVTTPGIPGLELRIPAGSVVKNHLGRVSHTVGITPIPADRPPYPLATNVSVPIYYTIQPGSGYVEQPQGLKARIIYPNYNSLPPGARANFWQYDPDVVGWHIYGLGTVTSNGKQIVPDPAIGLYEFTGAMINDGETPPCEEDCADEDQDEDGDPVHLATGLFALRKLDLAVRDVIPLAVKRYYVQNDTSPRPFGIGITHPYQMFLWSANQYQEADLILPSGAKVHYVRTSPGTGYADAVFENGNRPGAFFESRITWNGNGWDLKLKNGLVYVFGENAPLQSIRDRYGNTVTVTRNIDSQTGKVSRVTSPNGRWIQFTYDTSNRVSQVTDNIGRQVGYVYDRPGDPPGRLWKVTDPGGGVTEYTYDASGRMKTIKDALGIVFLTNDYDSNGRVSRQTEADQTTYLFAYTLDSNGRVTQTDVTNRRGYLRHLEFNGAGYTVTDTRAVGQPEAQPRTYVPDPTTNLLTSMTDALGRQTSYGYDPMGNVLTVTRPGPSGNVTWTYTYEPTFNRLQSIKDPLNHQTTYIYDPQGNLTITNPLGKVTTITFDAQGRPLTVKDPLNHTWTLTYDGADLASIKNQQNQTTTFFTDSVGRVVSVKDPLGNQTRYVWTALNRLSQSTDPLGNPTGFIYDANGTLRSVQDARGGLTQFAPDAMDRLQTRTDPLQHPEGYTYDENGNRKTFTDRNGQLRIYTYDPLDRLKRIDYQDGSSTTYAWDPGNRLTQVVDSLSGTITRTPDPANNLHQEQTPQGTVTYVYDDAGRRASMTVAGQPQVLYGFDAANRLTTVTQGAATVTLDYDDANRRQKLTLPNNVKATYNYDTANRLTSITFKKGSTTLGDLTYTYDAAGRRTSVTGAWARTGLPPALAAATYNAANQQTTWGGQPQTFDLNGSLTSDGPTTYTWDARNRLSAITGGITASFQYDPLGRRTRKVVNGQTTDYLYDRRTPVQELSGESELRSCKHLVPGRRPRDDDRPHEM